MAKEINQEQKATDVAVIFADWALEQIERKEPEIGLGIIYSCWVNDCERLENKLEESNKNPSYENATKLTDLACGLMKIYQNIPYKEGK
tara:strand:+ start:366 stop:632 length:267 start_codon:yes stop_codon:yes gene_type:complete